MIIQISQEGKYNILFLGRFSRRIFSNEKQNQPRESLRDQRNKKNFQFFNDSYYIFLAKIYNYEKIFLFSILSYIFINRL